MHPQMGVHEMGLRKNLLRSIDKFKLKAAEERAAAKAKGIESGEVRKCHVIITIYIHACIHFIVHSFDITCIW